MKRNDERHPPLIRIQSLDVSQLAKTYPNLKSGTSMFSHRPIKNKKTIQSHSFESFQNRTMNPGAIMHEFSSL